MEKNLHDDNLDDYVRRSFDDFEVPPAADMWARVASELDEPEEKPVVFWWHFTGKRGMVAAAAIALLLTTMVAERYYYAEKNQDKYQPIVQKNADQNARSSAGSTSKEYPSSTISGDKKPISEKNNATAPPYQPTLQSSLFGPKRGTDPVEEIIPKDISPIISISNSENTQQSAEQAEDPVSAERLAIVPAAVVAAVPDKQVLGIFFSQKTEMPETAPLSPHRNKKSWYLAFQAAPVRMKEHRSLYIDPSTRRWVSAGERIAPSAEWSLVAGQKRNKRIGWETGLAYRSVSRTAVHAPRFRFRDGVSRPGTEEYDFSYALDTYGGSSEVTLRMEQEDPSVSIPDNEAVSMRVRTSEHTQILKIPLLLTAQVGQGRLTGVVKAGITGNYILKNQVTISTRESTSMRFRVATGYTLLSEKSNPLFLGYTIAAGLNYKIAPRISLLATPVLSGDFNRKSSANTKLPGLVTTGINLGLKWDIAGL